MKKSIPFILIPLLFIIIITSCKQKETLTDNSEKLSVVTTIFAPYDFVREIVGDKANTNPC